MKNKEKRFIGEKRKKKEDQRRTEKCMRKKIEKNI